MSKELPNNETTHEPQVETNTGNDFFSNPDSDFESFMAHMKTPKKEVSQPPGLEKDEPEEEQISAAQKEEMLEYLDYSPAHYKSAQFWLIQIDKLMALGAGIISGLPAEKYRQRLEKPKSDDYEAEITAALLKKYQMEMSLEGMFITAMILAYGPVFYDANQDKAKIRKMQQQEQEKQPQEAQSNSENDFPRIIPNKSRKA